jgi:nitrite reductase/ring-hydroxylating ferredoxin subunit
MFGPSVACATYICPLLTSGDSSPHLAMTVALRQTTRSPRVLRTHLHAYVCRIYAATFRASTGLCITWPAHPIASPLSAGCSSDQRFAYGFLRIPPRGGHPCRSANTSPCRVCRGLAPPSECALPGAPNKKPLPRRRVGAFLCFAGRRSLRLGRYLLACKEIIFRLLLSSRHDEKFADQLHKYILQVFGIFGA